MFGLLEGSISKNTESLDSLRKSADSDGFWEGHDFSRATMSLKMCPRFSASPCGDSCWSLVGAVLARLGCGGVQMADGDGERIGGVGGLGHLSKIEKTRHHLLNLMLFS